MSELDELLRRLIHEREHVRMPRWVLTAAPARVWFKDGTSITVMRSRR